VVKKLTKAQTHQVIVNINDEWETTPLLLEEVMKKYNIHPTLDVCATTQNHKLDNYFTISDNALNKEWNEDFFMNPPYSEIEAWMKQALLSHIKYNVNGLVLVFSKTSTKWWHEFVEGKAETHFQKGRIRFLLNGIEPRYCKHCKKRSTKDNPYCISCGDRIPKSSPTYDSVWIVYRKEEK